LKKYPMVTGKQFTDAAMNRNFAALKAKREALQEIAEASANGAAVQTGA